MSRQEDALAGTTLRLECRTCVVEWEITVEPKAKRMPLSDRQKFPSADVLYCPSCGEPVLSDVDDDDDDEPGDFS